MFFYNEQIGTSVEHPGGYTNNGMPIDSSFVALTPGVHFQRGMYYRPSAPCSRSRVGIVVCHTNNDYTSWEIGGEMARRGYRVLCCAVTDDHGPLDGKLLDVKRAVGFLKDQGAEKIALMGHSGGATLMTAYQRAAENGIVSLKRDDLLVKCALEEELPAADLLMTLDSNWGNGAMTLLSVDPALCEKRDGGLAVDPELDIFDPRNGFDPQGSHYSEAFLNKFFRAQAERNARLVQKALDRMTVIQKGKGFYTDDEPFAADGASQIGPCNKLIPQDLRLVSRTRMAHDLLRGDGSVSHQIVLSARPVKHIVNRRRSCAVSALITTVREFLEERAVFAKDGYAILEDRITGIGWDQTFNCPPGNIRHIHAPLLSVGMTGGYEGLAAEEIYLNSPADDKTIAFVEGATHTFLPETSTEQYPGQYGDTRKTLFDLVDRWLSARL